MIEYIEERHIYLVDGIIVPSVTQVVSWIIGEDLSGIPERTLYAKAQYGTEVHKLIEEYENGLTMLELSYMKIDPNQKSALKSYAKLKEGKFTVKDMERIIYNDKLAGRYDILTNANEIIDIKTTYKLNTEFLKWQIGFYYYLLGIDKRFGYCMWLPKQTDKHRLAMIENHTIEECEKALNAYIDSH